MIELYKSTKIRINSLYYFTITLDNKYQKLKLTRKIKKYLNK